MSSHRQRHHVLPSCSEDESGLLASSSFGGISTSHAAQQTVSCSAGSTASHAVPIDHTDSKLSSSLTLTHPMTTSLTLMDAQDSISNSNGPASFAEEVIEDDDTKSNRAVSCAGEEEDSDCPKDKEHEDSAKDESDYEYDYEDDDHGHFTGFLAPADKLYSDAAASAVAQQLHHANVIENTDSNGDQPMTQERSGSDVSVDMSVSPPEELTSQLVEQPAKRKSNWKEPSHAAVSMSLRAEREKSGGKRRLASDLYKIMMGDTTEQGFSMEPSSEDSMDKWKIKLFGFDPDSNLQKDMDLLGLEHVELEMTFPDDYPFAPPFVRVVRPRFKRQTGFVMNGALCMELLTNEGWNPVNDIESVIVSIRSLLVVGDGRLSAAVQIDSEPNTESSMSARKESALAAPGGVIRGAKKQAFGGMNIYPDDDSGDHEGKRFRGADGVAVAGRGGKDEDDDDRMEEEGEDYVSEKSAKKRSIAKISATQIGSYTEAESKAAYSHLSDYHKKKGWDSSGWWSRKG